MAATKTKTESVEYDFDNWDEDLESKAILAAVPDVRYIIVERRFVGRLSDGTIIEVPLTISLEEVDEMQAELQPVDQFRTILRKISGDEAANDFAKRDIAECVILAEKYFRTLQRVQQAAFPE